MKAVLLVALVLVALMQAAVGEKQEQQQYYTYTQIKTPCDVTTRVRMAIDDSEPVEMTTRSHGWFSITTSATGVVLDRPDLGNTLASMLSFQCSPEGQCNVLSFIVSNSTPLVFTHREETTYNGHRCYKYYNSTEDVMYADAEGMLWGRVITLQQRQVLNYSALTFEKHRREDFVLPAGTICPDHPEAFEPPSEDAFDSACENNNSGASTLSLAAALVSLIALALALFF